MNFTCIDYNAEIYRCDDCGFAFGVIDLYNHNCPIVSPNSVNNMTIFHEAWKAAQALSDIAPELRGQNRSLYDVWDAAVAQNPALATEGIDEATMQVAAKVTAREARKRGLPDFAAQALQGASDYIDKQMLASSGQSCTLNPRYSQDCKAWIPTAASIPDPKPAIDLSALRDEYPRPLLATPRAGGADIGQQEKKESSPFMKIKLLAQEFAHEDQIGIGYYLFREGQDAPTYGHALRFYNGDPEQIVTALRALASHIEAKFKE